MNKIAVLTDSGSGISIEEGKELGIFVLPLQVIIDNEAFDDGISMSNAQLIQELRNKKVPKTSTPTFASILSMFEQIKKEGYTQIIGVPLSRSLSSTYDYFTQAAKEAEIEIIMIEIYTTMFLQAHIAKEIKKLIDIGYSASHIQKRLEFIIQEAYSMILPSDLMYLKAGGRLTPTAASLAALLKIRPILHLGYPTFGKVDVFDKVRTDKKAMDVAIKALKKHFKNQDVFVYVGHTDNYPKALETKALLIDQGFNEEDIIINDIVAVIASHTGLNCIGIQMIHKA